ncbi:MAG: hypothetical protein VX210_03895 [Myxococcota bacterium]|nr:hypothetical protein [Myxococcota bacterium]
MEIITVIAVIATFGSIWWSVGNAQASRDKLSAALSEIETLKSKPSTKSKNNKKAEQGDQSSLKNEVASLKRDLNQAKKKSHDTQLELKAELDRERASRKELEKRLNETPAFREESTATKEPAAETKKAPQPAVEAQPSVTTKEAEAPVVDEETELGKKEALITKLREERESLIENKKKMKHELKDARYRLERYRRIDLIKQREHELVDDRLLTMGRLYYDVVSEMAALKGEVVPPKPRELREAEARAAERAARDAKAEAAKSKENEENEEAASLGSALQAEEAAQVAQIEDQANVDAEAPVDAGPVETEEQAKVSPDVAATATATTEVQANPA